MYILSHMYVYIYIYIIYNTFTHAYIIQCPLEPLPKLKKHIHSGT